SLTTASTSATHASRTSLRAERSSRIAERALPDVPRSHEHWDYGDDGDEWTLLVALHVPCHQEPPEVDVAQFFLNGGPTLAGRLPRPGDGPSPVQRPAPPLATSGAVEMEHCLAGEAAVEQLLRNVANVGPRCLHCDVRPLHPRPILSHPIMR